ncbi:hypothetical protein C8_254 [Cannes 8 virus]|nr:hypothetical protein C8_254 [Cannes 8 virus]
MEKFYQTRERVSLCCISEEYSPPLPEKYLTPYHDEKTANFGSRLPDGRLHGSFTEFHEGFTEVTTYDRGVKNGPWKKSSKRATCEGFFVDGEPEGEFTVFQRSEIFSETWPKEYLTVTSSVFYERGKGIKHVHNSSVVSCPLECFLFGEKLLGPHTVEWDTSKKDEIWFRVSRKTSKIEGTFQGLQKARQGYNTLWCYSELLPKKAVWRKLPESGGNCIVLP